VIRVAAKSAIERGHEYRPAACTCKQDWRRTQLNASIDGSTMGGQQYIALVMSAQAQERQIIVQDNGTCSAWGDTETASYIEVIL
jgi:hypothetical protein